MEGKCKSGIYFQIDGEPFFVKGAYRVKINWKEQVLFGMFNARQPGGVYKSNIIKVLQWAKENNHINEKQKDILTCKFMKVF